MKRYFVVILLAMMGQVPIIAQDKEAFDSFRKGIKEDFRNFREKLLIDYDNYLEGVWAEYNAFRGKERNPLPKPSTPPVARPSTAPPVSQLPLSSPSEQTPMPKRIPQPTFPVLSASPTQATLTFDFYCISVEVPQTGLETVASLSQTTDFAALWRIYSDKQVAPLIVPVLRECATKYNLNDWFLFELVRCYTDNLFRAAGERVRISMQHYLLNYMGYNVRIGIDNSGHPMLLVAIAQMVYARTFAEIDGQKYYLYYDENLSVDKNGGTFRTCQLPEDAEKGNPLDLLIYGDLKIPYIPQAYALRYKGLEIKGNVNANLKPMLFRYPQMPIECYAQSMVNKAVHDEVVRQLQQQVEGMSKHQAVDSLLQFVQSAFEYATDDEQHGFEKPYFFEELLFYPQCDCEDRSIFYSYLLWHILGVENLLINFPGHEAVAVQLDEAIHGDSYRYNNKVFYISDPTYIGAQTGMCMPDYRNKQPQVDFYCRK